ncbi:inorganic anion transporter, SulP family, partial [Teladorsagia circumcincta]
MKLEEILQILETILIRPEIESEEGDLPESFELPRNAKLWQSSWNQVMKIKTNVKGTMTACRKTSVNSVLLEETTPIRPSCPGLGSAHEPWINAGLPMCLCLALWEYDVGTLVAVSLNHIDLCIFDEEFGLLRHTKKKASTTMKLEQMRLAREHCHPRALLDFVPILKWLPKYSVKKNLIRDIIGGLTVGIMHVPQGVFAVVSLMTGSCNQRVSGILEQKVISNNGSLHDLSEEAKMQTSVAIVTSLAMCVGLVQIAMAVLRLDFLTAFLSDQIIGGFTTGASVHVFTAQLNKIFGVPLPRRSGPGKLFLIYKDLIGSILDGYANWITFSISVSTIALLFLVRAYLDPLIRKRCSVPVPYDLFVMIIGTIVSYVINLHGRFEVKIIGKIPTGIPAPALPDVSLFRYFLGDALAISVVVLVVTVSMGKLFAKKHKYEIDVRQ